MYPWEEINPDNDSSLALIKECSKRGHGVAICTPSNLTIRDSVTNAFCTVIGRMERVPSSLKSFYNKAKLRVEMLPLAGFDVIFFRANPPTGSDYAQLPGFGKRRCIPDEFPSGPEGSQ